MRRALTLVTVLVALATGAPTPPAWAVAHPSSPIRGVVADLVLESPPSAERPRRPAAVQRVLRTRSATIPLTANALPGHRSGDEVEVTFQDPDPGLTAPSAPVRPSATARPSSPARAVASAVTVRRAAPAPASSGARGVHVALVLPRGAWVAPELSAAEVAERVAQASDYWASQTGGAVTFAVSATTGWIRSRHGCDDIYSMWDEAQALLPESVGRNQHLLVVVPPEVAQSPGCDLGFATLGYADSGGAAYVTSLNPSLVAHELGHNLGLQHANALVCPSAQDGAHHPSAGWSAGCRDQPYDDLFDVMGYSGPGFGEGNLNGPHLDALALTPAAIRSAPLGVSTWSLAPLSATATPGRVLRVADPTGPTYYLEYRTATGRDRGPLASPFRPSAGVRVVRADPRYGDPSGSYELDASPGGAQEYDRALAPGKTFTSASGQVSVTVNAASPTAAVVTVTAGGLRSTSTSPRPNLAGMSMRAPARAPASASVAFSTVVSSTARLPLGGWPVRLQQLRGRAAWRDVAARVTAADGRASARLTVARTGVYRWRSAASSGDRLITSAPVTVTAVAAVVGSAPARVAAGGSLTVTGTVSAVPSPVVHLQLRRGARAPWLTVGRATVAGRLATASVRVRRAGIWWTRLVVRPGPGYQGSSSAPARTVAR